MVLIFHAQLNNNFNDVVGTVDGTPSNISWESTRRGLKPELNGTNSKITFGNIGTIKTIALWVHLRSTTESVIDLNGTQTIDIAAGTVRGNNWTTPTIYIDGAATASLSNLTGYHQITITTATGIASSAVVAGLISASYGHIILDDIRGYDNELSSGEALSLYNSTSAENGVQMAEMSYQHDTAAIIPSQIGEVLRIGGKLPGDAVDTISDRALTNDATIFGAMPADDNYFIGGRRFDGVDDYLNCGNDNIININGDLSIISFIKYDDFVGVIISNAQTNVIKNYEFSILDNGKLYFAHGNGVASELRSISLQPKNQCVVMAATRVGNGGATNSIKMYIDGEHHLSGTFATPPGGTASTLLAQGTPSGFLKHVSILTILCDAVLSSEDIALFFNKLAVLPIFKLNFRDYPDNPGDTWTDNTPIPFSSGVVGANGTFSVDGDQLICGEDTSTCTFRNDFKLDGQEYITVVIGGIEYTGTGTITQGTVTVSIAQGSNKITIAASNGDVIYAIRIQFRETV